jgi:hypothetical protein
LSKEFEVSLRSDALRFHMQRDAKIPHRATEHAMVNVKALEAFLKILRKDLPATLKNHRKASGVRAFREAG